MIDFTKNELEMIHGALELMYSLHHVDGIHTGLRDEEYPKILGLKAKVSAEYNLIGFIDLDNASGGG